MSLWWEEAEGRMSRGEMTAEEKDAMYAQLENEDRKRTASMGKMNRNIDDSAHSVNVSCLVSRVR